MQLRLIFSAVVIVVLAGQIIHLTRSAGQAPESPAPIERTDDSEVRGLRAEVAALTARLEALESNSLVPVTAASAPAREMVDPGWVTREELEERLAELAGNGSVKSKGGAAPSLLDAEAFDEALQASRKRQATAKFESKLEARATQLDQTVAKYESALGLNSSQSGALRTALENQQLREAELLRQWNAGVGDEELGELKRSDRQAFEDELGGFLTDEQRQTVLRRGRGKD